MLQRTLLVCQRYYYSSNAKSRQSIRYSNVVNLELYDFMNIRFARTKTLQGIEE